MSQPKAIGIDLGTTNSAVAWVDETGHSAMVRNLEGDLLTPSIVLFDDAEVVVGKEARTATVVNPDRVAIWVKRDMGAPLYNRPIRGEYLPPEVIQACILRKLNSDVVHALGPESRVVITVPAYFDEPRRKATADAGEMAGLTVLDIVNEPTAAAMAFGEVLGYLAASATPQQELTVLVYDLGGGTFDATLLKLSPGSIQTIATDGDVQLGGYDWDLRLVDFAAEAFQKAHGLNPRESPAAIGRLFNAAAEAKHSLSARSQAAIRVDYNGHAMELPITREKFEELCADLLERTAYTTRQLIGAAGLSWKDVQRVLLVGGSTRMPMVPRMLHALTGIVPDHSVNPDEAVARGAALYANYLLSLQTPGMSAGFRVVNVNSHSLGIEGIEPATLRKTNVILIPRNSPLPARCMERFATKSPGQRSIVLQILEGESSLPGECTAIGRTVIRDLPPGLPQGWPIDVTFEYGTNGRLNVKASVSGMQHDVTLDLERDVGLSNDGIAHWKQAVSAQGGFDAFESLLSDVLNLAAPGSGASLPGDFSGHVPPPAASRVPPAPPVPAASLAKPLPPAAGRVPLAPPVPPATASAAYPPGSIPPPASWPGPSGPAMSIRPGEIPDFQSVPAGGPLAPPMPARMLASPVPLAAGIGQGMGQASATGPAPSSAAPRGFRGTLINVIGLVVTGGCGVAAAYLILHWVRPAQFPLPW
jgi:molecular chaperone DnaK